jgi:uncharacterized membrane protein YadS
VFLFLRYPQDLGGVNAAGQMMNDKTIESVAVITKLTRVMLLGPYLLLLARFVNKGSVASKVTGGKSSFPWFAMAFVLTSCINSTAMVPQTAKFGAKYSPEFILLSITALGVETNLSKVKAAGAKPFILAAVLCCHLIISGYFVTKQAMAWF